MLSRTVAAGALPSIILWGPPGAARPRLLRCWRGNRARAFARSPAVAAGVAELREAVEQAQSELEAGGRRTGVLIDEINCDGTVRNRTPSCPTSKAELLRSSARPPKILPSRLSRRCSREPAYWCCARSATRISQRFCAARSATPNAAWGASGANVRGRGAHRIGALRRGDARRALNMLEVAATLARTAGRALDRARAGTRGGATEDAALRPRRRRALQRHLGLHQEHARQRPGTRLCTG